MNCIRELLKKGVNLIDKADASLQAIGQRLGFMPLSWRQTVMHDKSRDGLMWRIPDPAVPTASALSRVQAIVVAENEMVMLLRDGVLNGALNEERQIILPPGFYDIRRTVALRGQIEIVWFTTREFNNFRWGVADVLSQDRVTIGASGYYSAAIVDPERFYSSVAGNEQVYTEAQWIAFAKPTVSTIIRNIMASKTVMEFQQAQPEFQSACQEALARRFADWGMRFIALTIETQNIPEEFRKIAQGRVLVTMDKEAEIAGAQADVELAKLKAQQGQFALLLEAERIRQLGQARVDVWNSEQSVGLDPLELERIQAVKILAEHPAEGTLVDNRPQIVSQLLPQPPVAPQINPMIVAGQPILVPASPPNVINAPPPTASSGANETMSREKIQEMLDKLDERFANGEISEQVYLTLQAKWEKRLEKLS